MTVNRRTFLVGLPAAIAAWAAQSQTLPFALRLHRRTGWEELMHKNACVIGDLYQTKSTFPVAELGTKICNALELAYRNNSSQISSIPPGGYEGFVRTDGARGWRIELVGTGDRRNIQLHVGNRPLDTIGCILPGLGDSTDLSCNISYSKEAMAKLKGLVGDNPNVRVALLVEP